MKQKLLSLCLLAITLFFVGCEKEDINAKTTVSVDQTTYSYKATIGDVEICVSPLILQVGESFTVSAAHKKNKNVDIELISSSLGLQTTITTPNGFAKTVETAGEHILTIKYSEGNSTTKVNATIIAL